MRRTILGVAIAAAVVATMFVGVAPASAAVSATCMVGDLTKSDCIFWGQSHNGSLAGVTGDVLNFPLTDNQPYVFQTASTAQGRGQHIGNNNGSNVNEDTSCLVALWYNPAPGPGLFSGPMVELNEHDTTGFERDGTELGPLLNNIRGQSWSCPVLV
jgi:hypothetical protein